ncbi:permease for cytosine/purine, uracil, thiamine, allantoin family protein [Acinetobacter baumannii 25493_8]|uniref:purine-cytosine permease family protein n=3 Tax=Acinetobacter baumannii TaxID=470 RepID=UPI0002B9B7E7|nr:cytosine permease [Acinetobacter baumannii]EYD50166.1 permease for cytosine/purine, uracil, thiamine, allantoin family protein [Acinetobacter baumannii 25493_4]EYS12744.1 permease for cytosine/purine, uracil, thiamine, allantoin family protein [Acinetobacter baumannii 25569_7]EHU2134863.1 cytosine permease [Acinetobacter baumannii]EIG0125592.1 cytosine permease [Acinetobacter baumannii]EIY0853184.1 cytosine permease [Acinetobacter baumannii]
MSQNENSNNAFAIESHSIDYVAPSERNGKVRDLFTLWFCTNIAPLAVITGAMSILTFNLNIVSALFAICCGHFFGAAILALTSAQGPQVGIPQMIQSRAQFGRYGALLVVLFTTLIYLGFFISNIILSGKTLHTVVPAIPVPTATVIGAIAATTIGVIGYHFIHKFNKIGTWFMGGSLLIGLMIMVPHINADVLAKGSFNMKGWFAMFGLCAVWQISFSPYTSDYSRYLPKSIGIYKPFIFTYLGASLGTIFAMAFGTIAVSIGSTADAMEAVKSGTGMFGYVLMILFLCNIIGHNAMNLYGAVLSCITSIQTFAGQWMPSRNIRVVLSIIVLVLATLTALWASSNFISFFLNVIFALLFILVPWVSINLLDFYVVNKKSYDIQSIFARDGGIYGKFNAKALTAYFIGIAVQIPFLKNAFFTGALADVIPDADISWVIGLVVSLVVYYIFNLGKIKCSAPALNAKLPQ